MMNTVTKIEESYFLYIPSPFIYEDNFQYLRLKMLSRPEPSHLHSLVAVKIF